jgi:hypothetical protein
MLELVGSVQFPNPNYASHALYLTVEKAALGKISVKYGYCEVCGKQYRGATGLIVRLILYLLVSIWYISPVITFMVKTHLPKARWIRRAEYEVGTVETVRVEADVVQYYGCCKMKDGSRIECYTHGT